MLLYGELKRGKLHKSLKDAVKNHLCAVVEDFEYWTQMTENHSFGKKLSTLVLKHSSTVNKKTRWNENFVNMTSIPDIF